MKNDQMAHLHLHTDASVRDGLGTVRRMVTRAKKMGFRYIAMTDHGTLANAVTFSIEAQAAGIKPLLGMEGYIHFDGVIGHITLLADGMAGWNSLLTLNNLAHQSEYRQPAFSIDELVGHSDSLVCLTGCIASPFHQLSYDEAYRLGLRLKSEFGHRLFAEAMFVNDGESFKRSFRLAERLGLKTVITNDVHFPDAEDASIHPILTQMKSGFSYDSGDLYLKSFNELTEAAMRHGFTKEKAEEMLFRTNAIAKKLEPISLRREPHLPHIKFRRSLREIVLGSERAKLLGKSGGPEYEKRFEYEMRVIAEMGYEDYFLILNDILWKARKAKVKVGPGRGSGAGSLVLYILGITDVDPIVHNLQFERFLNPHRKGMPDVDVDLESERRGVVLDYAHEEYGAVPIATYSRYSHKSLTRDLGKMFRVDKDVIDKAADGGASSDEFAAICEAEPKFLAAYESFMGQIRHKGKHAGGVIITSTPVPVERIGDEFGAAWTEGKNSELSYAGIVKFDLLGLSVLSALRKCEEYTGTEPPYPADYAPEFGLFRDGDLSGIFQFSGSEGIRDLTVELAPEKFDDLVAINALYRPGAIDSGTTARYPKWKRAPRDVPAYIADVLEPTYGAIVYQEQVMEVYRRTVGGTLADADIARRMIAKPKHDDPRWREKFATIRDNFITAAISADVGDGLLSKSEARDLWSELETHSRYSFNKAHATAYAMIAWQCAWWKFNHPAVFYAAMLTTDPAQEQTYIIDAIQSGLTIVPPHVNVSGIEWRALGKEIYMPLTAVKFLGESGAEILVAEREAIGGEFPDIETFMAKVPKKYVRARAREGLLALNGYKGMYGEPKTTEEIKKVLGVKEYPAIERRRENQQKYLGFIIPDKALLDEFAKHRKVGMEVGIINNIDHRESKWGPYTVYRLSPKGVFWSRDVRDLEKGTIVAVRVSSKNGKAQRIKLL